MNISNTDLHKKILDLLPGLSSSITPEVLSKICSDETVKPFLKWFYENISCDNILSEGDQKLKNYLQKTGTWIPDDKLDHVLENAVQDCPELLQLLESNIWNSNQPIPDFDMEKEFYDMDLDCIRSIEDSIKRLKENEDQLDADLDREGEEVEKEQIKVKQIYSDCLIILEEFDIGHRKLARDVELLANTYIQAAQKKGPPCTWTQMPLDLFVKQMDIYNSYLNVYAKRQFENSKKEAAIQDEYASFLNESKERQGDEKIYELLNCQRNLLESKIEEINAKAQEEASKAMANYAQEIYNSGNLKVPHTPMLARADIVELTRKRDFLEENVELLRDRQLEVAAKQYSEWTINKILEKEAEARLDRRRNRLLKLDKLRNLAREHGHAHSNLLCMLLELQVHRIKEIIEFIVDARYYLATEYCLSSMRCESMQKLQEELTSLTTTSLSEGKAFTRIFNAMIETEDGSDRYTVALMDYDKLVAENKAKIQLLLNDKLQEKLECTEKLETEVSEIHTKETKNGPTNGFKSVPCSLQDEIEKTNEEVDKVEAKVEAIRKKLKEMMKNTSTPSLDRESLLLWQKFLADPNSMKSRYEELQELVNNSCNFPPNILS